MITIFVVCQFLLLLNAESGSVVYWLCIHALLMVSLLVIFEMVEHLAAHSRNGVLVKASGKNPLTWILMAVEYVRIYFVWPLYYWAPRRYFLTHTLHHHVENNGPADWQSTLRFDLTSIADFAKSLLWLQSSMLLPLDTGRYLFSKGRFELLRKLVLSSLYNYFVIILVLLLEPVLGLLLFCLYLGMAWVFHSFIFAWHGFHDATKPYDIVASNNSTGHYSHHKQPGMHLFSATLRQQYETDSAVSSEPFPVHQSSVAFDVISNNWLLVQCLLWQQKFPVIRLLVKADHLDDHELERLVTGLQLRRRHHSIAKMDAQVSKFVGATLEKLVLLIAPRKHRHYLQNGET